MRDIKTSASDANLVGLVQLRGKVKVRSVVERKGKGDPKDVDGGAGVS